MDFKNHSLPVEDRVADLLARLTLDEKISLMSETAGPIERLGVPAYHHGNEALHGVVRPGRFTVFPQAIALAATWDPGLLQRVSAAISDEARARHNATGGGMADETFGDRYNGLLTFWSPTVNMARDPRWGRTPETYGEDPFLAGRMGAAFVRGLQGDDPKYLKAVSTPKHYVANNEEHNRFACKAVISERALREYYLPAFRACVQDGGCGAVMGAYNAVNGVPCNANAKLLTTILRDEWGFDGYVVCDCGAISHLVDPHHFVDSPEQAAAGAVEAGVDLECGSCGKIDQVFLNYMRKAHEMGLVAEETIDRAVTRLLTARFRLGMFDPPESVPWCGLTHETVGCPEHVALAKETALQSMVLLKNDPLDGAPLLPLRDVASIAVVGNIAARCEFGDYSGVPANPPVTPLQGLLAAAGDRLKILHVPWRRRGGSADEYEVVPQHCLRPAGRGAGDAGLRGEYYGNTKFAGTPATRTDPVVDFDWQNMPPDPLVDPAGFACRWTGVLVAETSGPHRVRLAAEGSSQARLTLRGEATPAETTVELEAGIPCEVAVEFALGPGRPRAKLEWRLPAPEADPGYGPEVEAARQCDVVVAIVGLGKEHEREGGDRMSLGLPEEQVEMIERLAAANPRTVVVLVNGGPVTIRRVHDRVPAILEAWYPGEQGGHAIAATLFGHHCPAGRLPLTFYESEEQLPPFDDYEVANGRTYMYLRDPPLYPFGHGLSYTAFAYGPLSLSRASAGLGDTVVVSLDVTNTGPVCGDEVVQLYVRSPGGHGPAKRLRGFRRVSVESGHRARVEIPLAVNDLAHWDDERGWVVLPGVYEIEIGASSSDIRQRVELTVIG